MQKKDEKPANVKVDKTSRLPAFDTFLEQASALELARRSLFGAPVYTVVSLIMLVGTPMLMDYGVWSVVEMVSLIMLGAVRVWFAIGFPKHYRKIGERAVLQFSVLTALQSLTLGILSGIVIWQYWATKEVVLTIVLAAGCIAAGTSALSVRRSAHLIFLACVLAPFGIAVLLVGGVAKAMLIVGFLSLMAFLVQDGGQAKQAHIQRLKAFYDAQITRRRSALEIEAKKEFIREIGHEIRTPVNSIIGMTALLLDENLSKRPREIAETIRKKGNELLGLVGNVPGAIPASNETEANRVGALDLSQCVNRVLDLYVPEAKEKGLKLGVQLDNLPSSVISCDEDKLEQVLANLLANAVQFTEQGSISLETACECLEDGFLQVEFKVIDSGVGIPHERLESVFDPFSPSGAKSSGRFGGGGLGLPLCKGLVELLGGNISIDSKLGKGTTVTFTIRVELDPLSLDGPEAQWQSARLARSKNVLDPNLARQYPHNILVVDDDDIHRQIVCVQLQKMGYAPTEAADGEEAIAAVMQGDYDLIFMDLRMPHMNGAESSRWIRERFDGGRGVRIIALTGDATIEARERCMLAGMDNFVTKPVQVKDLEAILRHSTGRGNSAVAAGAATSAVVSSVH